MIASKTRSAKMTWFTILGLIVIPILVTGIIYATLTGEPETAPAEPAVIDVNMRQFEFQFFQTWDEEHGEFVDVDNDRGYTSIFEVPAGYPVIFKITSEDTSHGFYVDGFDMFAYVLQGDTQYVGEGAQASVDDYDTKTGQYADVYDDPWVFTRAGLLKVRCAVVCGSLHAFMTGEISVSVGESSAGWLPDPVFAFGFMVVAGAIVTLTYLGWKGRPKNEEMLGINRRKEFDVSDIKFGIGKWIRKSLQSRGFYFFLLWSNMFVFMMVYAAGFLGNTNGNKNFAIVVVWILWFAAVEYMIMFGGRTWCSMCPLPMVGEWIARRRLWGLPKIRNWLSLNKKYPKALDNMWPAALGFLFMSQIIIWIVTKPVITGYLFVFLISMGLILYLVTPERNFCRTVCMANAYIGYHSTASITAIRTRDPDVCRRCVRKECIVGSPRGYGCPWKLYPGGNIDSTYCGQCFECLKSCMTDNMTLRVGMFGMNLPEKAVKTKKAYDEQWMGFIRFTGAIFYELAFFGPFYIIKRWANFDNPNGANAFNQEYLAFTLEAFHGWLKWSFFLVGIALVLLPMAFWGLVWVSKKVSGPAAEKYSTTDLFGPLTYSLAPYGMTLWAAFGLGLVLVNWAYPANAFMDPFGLEWQPDWLKLHFHPLWSDWLPYFQMVFILFGLALALHVNYSVGYKMYNDHQAALRTTMVMSILYVFAGLVLVFFIMG